MYRLHLRFGYPILKGRFVEASSDEKPSKLGTRSRVAVPASKAHNLAQGARHGEGDVIDWAVKLITGMNPSAVPSTSSQHTFPSTHLSLPPICYIHISRKPRRGAVCDTQLAFSRRQVHSLRSTRVPDVPVAQYESHLDTGIALGSDSLDHGLGCSRYAHTHPLREYTS